VTTLAVELSCVFKLGGGYDGGSQRARGVRTATPARRPQGAKLSRYDASSTLRQTRKKARKPQYMRGARFPKPKHAANETFVIGEFVLAAVLAGTRPIPWAPELHVGDLAPTVVLVDFHLDDMQ
jgi:hypothetical protein